MKELNLLRAENAILREKARILDVLMTSDSLFTTRVVAESMGKSVKWLNDYLQEKKIQVKEKGQWKISRKYRDNGFVKKSSKKDEFGIGVTYRYWTGTGIKFIHDLLKKDGLI